MQYISYASNEASEWRAAIGTEHESLAMHDTWCEIRSSELLTNAKPLTCKYVFKLQRDEHGNVIRYKVRLVTRGFSAM